MSTKLWYLTHHRLLEGLPKASLEALERTTRMIALSREEPVYLPGEMADGLYLIKKGHVRISRLSESGRQTTLAILGPGDLFGELTLLQDVHDEVAQALGEALVCLVPRSAFERLMLDHSGLALKVTKLVGLRLRKLHSRIEDMAFRDAAGRIARVMLDLATEYGTPHVHGRLIGIKLSQQDLASLTGLTRQTASETLNAWQSRGLIRMESRRWVLRDLDGIEKLARQA
ncbi:MAG: Crp/Fnr family transcriptional regulator [bacterium]|nr:Crp/Fnr family transcriptional regulator [bacterium]